MFYSAFVNEVKTFVDFKATCKVSRNEKDKVKI